MVNDLSVHCEQAFLLIALFTPRELLKSSFRKLTPIYFTFREVFLLPEEVSTSFSQKAVHRASRASVLVKLSVTKDHCGISAVRTIGSNACSVSLVGSYFIVCLFTSLKPEFRLLQ